jgi:hypothetical protein
MMKIQPLSGCSETRSRCKTIIQIESSGERITATSRTVPELLVLSLYFTFYYLIEHVLFEEICCKVTKKV